MLRHFNDLAVQHFNERVFHDRLTAAGWSQEAIYDAITVCALFKFYNAWIDATGVHDLPAGAYEMSGRRMAAEGYIRR